jgi:hypothetical protein
MRRFFHATDAQSAIDLLNGTPLSVNDAAPKKVGPSAPGFYLASQKGTAVFFGALHGQHVALLRYVIPDDSLEAMLAAGAVLGTVPQWDAPLPLAGRELFVPPPVYPMFNQEVKSDRITIHPSRP